MGGRRVAALRNRGAKIVGVSGISGTHGWKMENNLTICAEIFEESIKKLDERPKVEPLDVVGSIIYLID